MSVVMHAEFMCAMEGCRRAPSVVIVSGPDRAANNMHARIKSRARRGHRSPRGHQARAPSAATTTSLAVRMQKRAATTLPQRTLTFPDGSTVRGAFNEGRRLNGPGEWRSGRGESYVGEFVNDEFTRGCFTEASGNKYVGGFSDGAFEGLGTYLYADGRVDVRVWRAGEEVGDGVSWSSDSSQAWRLRDGEVVCEISEDEADAIAFDMGSKLCGICAIYPIPTPEMYQLSAISRARQQAAVGAICSTDVQDVCETYVHRSSADGRASGSVVAHSRQPLIDATACEAIIAECEEIANEAGGWNTKRHTYHPTTDFPLAKLPRSLAWFTDSVLPDVAFPFLAHAFGFAMPTDESRLGFRISDAFVVKYDAAAGQKLLSPHRDGCLFSFNIALNDLDEYEGGGTYFRQLERDAAANTEFGVGTNGALRSPKGHMLAHSSALMHGGHPITSGVRYILVAFVTVEPHLQAWAAQFHQHIAEQDEHDKKVEEEKLEEENESNGGDDAGPSRARRSLRRLVLSIPSRMSVIWK